MLLFRVLSSEQGLAPLLVSVAEDPVVTVTAVGINFLLHLSEDAEQNERLNFLLLYVGSLPVSFVIVFFGLGAT